MGGGAPSVTSCGTLLMQRWPVRSWGWTLRTPTVLHPLECEWGLITHIHSSACTVVWGEFIAHIASFQNEPT